MSKQLRQEIIDSLQALGSTPGEIAHTLGQWNCHGDVSCPGKCPVAVYLNQKFYPSLTFRVGGLEIRVNNPQKGTEFSVLMLEVPTITEFIDLFDGGHYPGLTNWGRHGRTSLEQHWKIWLTLPHHE